MLAHVALPVAFVFYQLAKILYNLYFHPLAKFPGPKLAAATHAYEFYWSVIRDGQFIWEIERLHKKYGRASPMYDEEEPNLRVTLTKQRPNRANHSP